MGVTKQQVEKAVLAVQAEMGHTFPHGTPHATSIRSAIRYAMSCTVSRASFSQTRPPVPIVTLKDGSGQPAIRITEGMACEAILSAHMSLNVIFNGRVFFKDVVAAMGKVLPSLEKRVTARCQDLLNDKEAVQRKKDQLAGEDRRSRASRRAKLVREFASLIADGWSEEGMIQCFREALVSGVIAS